MVALVSHMPETNQFQGILDFVVLSEGDREEWTFFDL